MSWPIAPVGYLLHGSDALQELLVAVMMVVDHRLLVVQAVYFIKCLEIRQSYRVVIPYSSAFHTACTLLFTWQSIFQVMLGWLGMVWFSQVRFGLVRYGLVWLGTVWFGYISFLPKSQALAVSITQPYEDTVFVRLWLDQVRLGLVTFRLYKLSIFILLLKSQARAVSISEHLQVQLPYL